MNTEILKSIIFNVSLLVLIAQVLARIGFVKKYILHDRHNLKEQVILVILFSCVCIISNYTGYKVNGAYANTRVIGVMASAYIGGPLVGIMTAIIAGTHRLLMDINSFSSIACVTSTIVEGFFAAIYSKKVKKLKYDSTMLFCLTFVAEIIQMFIILLVAKPYELALQLVSSIAIPMVFFNSFGMVFFVSVFKSVFVEHEQMIGEKLKLTFEITERCIPLLRTGLYDEANCSRIGDIILTFFHNQGVLFTDTERILSSNGNLAKLSWNDKKIPEIVKQVLTENTVCVKENAPEGDVLYDVLQKLTAIGAPLTKDGQPFGCMVIFVRSYKISFQSDIEFVNGLSKLFSLQYELSEKDKQKELLQKAEYHSLQSQINPHFIFNALNTISTFCREKPEMARELLIALATYFRKSLQTQNTFVSLNEEMQYVNAYLQIEKARFDDRLEIEIDILGDLECRMPCLILQPIVENAVVHGAMKRRHGIVKIAAKDMGDKVMISVADNGYGIEQEVIDAIMENKIDSSHIGLSNVHRRLLLTYGKNHGLEIQTSSKGTVINIYIPKS
ncbi:histidine kinase [Lachnospiraceae bacterium MD1]|uniref:Histidine kinase n=1 Tax=Variimorphobacter saccharofermentans TaxID=2755051 RepID=A0A839JVV8_9FIRM|nr:LytS/YhcK type 5TM receptor domain-containing protein [Variimorphobacter saccharofermentans]MBB2181600.1 histidine kinase [Variimorphobacter saccharofermentans]